MKNINSGRNYRVQGSPLVIPAIDLQDGKAVRLYKGDYNLKTVYSDNPAKLAKEFETMGVKYLHIVDLDGAKSGSTSNIETIKKIRETVSIPIQVGGGIRNAETVEFYLNRLKVNRVILGTIAVENPAFVREMVSKYGAEKIIVGVDVRNSKVATSGWTSDSNEDYLKFIEVLKAQGLKYVVVTDISKDGTLKGPNWEMYEKIKGINVIVSGGISCDADIMKTKKYYGVIVGKAYYEKKINLRALLGEDESSADKATPSKRIIPCLDIKNGRVVKGINFEGLNDVGDPVEIAKRYENQGADEIVLLDISATNENRETFYDLLEKVSSQINIPVTVGGGINSIDSIRKCLGAGAAKVSINSAAVKNPQLIENAAREFGKRCIVLAIDGKEVDGVARVFIEGGRTNTGMDLIEWAKKCEKLGAGEILLTSMDADGVQTGYDIKMTKAVSDAVSIPVIASGGCGSVQDIVNVFDQTNCAAALVASLLHFGKATVEEIKQELNKEKSAMQKIEGIIPGIVQDFYSGRVLMLGYVNQESYEIMQKEGRTCFWSRSRKQLWRKGETSGNVQIIKNMAFDCDNDTLLIQVEQTGAGACHKGTFSCFGNESGEFNIFDEVYSQIKDREKNPKEKSYTNYLLDNGIDKVCKKVAEEAAEAIIAAKNNDSKELVGEIADLTFHVLVLMSMQGLTPREIKAKMSQRHTVEGNLKKKNQKGEL